MTDNENPGRADQARTGEAFPGGTTQSADSMNEAPLHPIRALNGAEVDQGWVCWRTVERNRKPTKVPRNASGEAKSNEPSTWMSRADAEALRARGNYEGVGVVLRVLEDGSLLGGLDLDTCRDPETGKPTKPWAQRALQLDCYAEVSPSGTGWKLFFLIDPRDVEAALDLVRNRLEPEKRGRRWCEPFDGPHPPGIELYLGGRYFTFTGQHEPGTPTHTRVLDIEHLRWLICELGPSITGGGAKAKSGGNSGAHANGEARQQGSFNSWDAAMRLAAHAIQNTRFKQLLEGVLDGLGDDRSRSAVAWHLGGHCKDAGLCEAAAKASLCAYLYANLSDYAAGRQWQRIWARVREGDDGAQTEAKRTLADQLTALVADAEFFSDHRGVAWVTLPMGGGVAQRTLRVESTAFRKLLRHRFHKNTGRTVSADAVKQAVDALAAKAMFEGDVCTVALRVAEIDGRHYLDLGRVDGVVVEIDANGWRIIEDAPVAFARPAGMRPLPIPERGGTLDVLRSRLNLRDEHAFILLCGWLVAAFRPSGPYPVLVLRGPPGAAKTSNAEAIRRLFDPATPATRNLPRDERDLFIMTEVVHIVAIDNIGKLSDWMSDAICRLATGGGYASRALYTNDEEQVFEAQRPIILNGIGAFITRGDLQDRALTLELAEIEPRNRKQKKAVLAAFEAQHPKLLGALLDAVVIGLNALPETHLENPPRMADFATWGVACELGYGRNAKSGAFLQAWEIAVKEALPDDLDADPFAAAIAALMAKIEPDDAAGIVEWQGTTGELLAQVNPEKRRDLPRSAAGVRSALDRAKPLLRRAGITFERARDGRKRILNIRAEIKGAGPSQPSSSSNPNTYNGVAGEGGCDGCSAPVDETVTGAAPRDGPSQADDGSGNPPSSPESMARKAGDDCDGCDGPAPPMRGRRTRIEI